MREFDLEVDSVRDLNAALHALTEEDRDRDFLVCHPNGRHSVAVGAMLEADIRIEGHVGYYCAGMNQRARVQVRGNVGPGVAENMMSGMVQVTGNASQYAGASGRGGLLVIEGDASSRCGISMKGVNIVVRGSVGHMSAFMAQAGALVVCGDAGQHLGDSIYEARLYVRGTVRSLGADCVEKDMTDEHVKELSGLLLAAGIEADAREFRRYGSARRLYNFNIDHVDEY